jgi:hypothetical protein
MYAEGGVVVCRAWLADHTWDSGTKHHGVFCRAFEISESSHRYIA